MATNDIRLYHVQGTHYECARHIGITCRDLIRKRIEDDRNYLTPMFNFVQTSKGIRLHQNFVEIIRKLFPWYWDEIRGIADGSKVPLEQILVLNFENETQTAYRIHEARQGNYQQEDNENDAKGCSTVLINRLDTNTLSLVHNEDNTAGLYETGYLVEADIKSSSYDDGTRHSPNERFIAYCYAGVIPGIAFGANMHGFAYALNALYPNFVGENGVPRLIINRALLSVANENQLDELVHTVPIAYAFCINGAFFREHNHETCHLLNYELGPGLNSKENFVSKCLVVNNVQYHRYQETNGTVCLTLNYLNHFNHYDRSNGLIVEREPLFWSRNRAQRALEIGEIFTLKDALYLLGDRTNEKFPIFFMGGTTDINLATLCTAHFNFHTRQLSIYRNNPKDNNTPRLIYNLDDLLEK
ncbi:unnamed protein product [Rotaria socialis]|uniref:Peptidase C45 hydrolase domain-containing protein n=1 Tax=Rotaria socialis TaxID=392032 RepID=A0A818QBU3_9BILA|nr:unnamed protein product [Rotaria socialis]CAF3535480.1 unnamed protein product [Rotaria socialis]CAF3636844.1 unnamed protein product [Rotaria socialis]CAF3715608.1 unnamed protein product [Rotaria socialis]CAF3740255.1 unnamed protein product [Rotaria socialis]